MKRTFAIRLALIVALASCSDEEADLKRKNVAPNPEDDPSIPRCTEVGKAYVGFAGTKLEDKRVNAKAGADRARIKPYSALRGEYERTLGVAPGSLEGAAASFGSPPARFSSEPRASAIQVFSAYRVAFDGCLEFVEKDKAYDAAPTESSAKTQCGALARKFWSRAATEDELKACTAVALTDSASEALPKRRWAYTCATLLSSAPFLTY